MRTAVLILALALGASVARADNELFYVGAGISSNKLSEITHGGLSYSSIDHTSWKALAGVRPLSFLAVEADYTDLGSGSSTFFVGGVGTCAVGVPNCAQRTTATDAKAFAGYLVGFLPVPIPFLDLYAKAGLSRWQLNGSGTQGTSLFSFSDSGTEFAWGAGAQVHLGMIGARLEYENFNIPNTSGAQIVSLDVLLRF
jgi:OmpA-OmpF porin, OOP family